MALRRATLSVLPLLLVAATAFAAAGDLDPSFGFGGNLVVPGSRAASAIVALPDGRFVVGGTDNVDTFELQGFSLVGLTANGLVDTTFGTNGFAGVGFVGVPAAANALLRQPDGMLVQAGWYFTFASGPVFAAARYDADGDVDLGFGTGGGLAIVDFPGGTYEEAFALGRQSDGKLVLVGYLYTGSTEHLAMARLDTDGTLDATFGTGGLVDMLPPGATFARGRALVVLPDDRLIVAGEANGNGVVLRFTADGALDTTFAVGGVATKGPGWSFQAVARRSDGALVAAGTAHGTYVTTPITYPVVARYDADGVPDPTFGTGGYVDFTIIALSIANPATATSVVAASDGSIVLGGGASTPSGTRFLLIRLTSTGWWDTTFGPSNGTATGPSGGIAALVQQPDAKLVAAGSRSGANDDTSAVIARFFGGVCGNAAIEPDEACDDGNLTSGDGCDANCTLTGCGNGIPTAGEACDDGNIADGDCCTSTCTLDAAGTACTEDSSLCTNDTCDGSGTCVHAYAPAPTCTQPSVARAASLQVTNAKRRVQWKWTKGGATPASELGDPTTTTSYALCVYDHEGGVPQLEHGASVGGGAQCAGRPCWKATNRGFAYKDKYGLHDSIYSMQLVADPTPGKSKITYKGVAMPSLTLPFAQDPNVVVQLRNSVGGCWGATFGTAKRNDTGKFIAKSD